MTSKLPTLPAGWEWKKLGEIADFQGGSQPPKDQFSSIPLEGYVRLIQIRDYKSDENIIYVKKESVRRFCNETDIMIGRYGPPVFQILRGLNGAYNVALMKTVFDEKIIDKDYLYFFLQNPNIQNYIIGLSQRAAGQSGVNKDALEKYPFPLPPLDEQKRLVSLLDTLFAKIDRSIELLEENIAAADALLPSALNTVFAVDIIQDWEKYQFDKISKFIDYRGKTPTKTEDGTVLITAKNVRFGYLSDEPKEYIADADYEGWMTRGIPNKGDVIFTTEAPLGNVAILNTNKKRAFAQRIVTFQPISDVYDSNFLYWYMLSPIFQKELYDSATGTTVKGIKTSILKKFKVPLPSLDIQTQTVAYLDSVRDRVERLKAAQNTKKSRLIALKASILDRAFKGEL